MGIRLLRFCMFSFKKDSKFEALWGSVYFILRFFWLEWVRCVSVDAISTSADLTCLFCSKRASNLKVWFVSVDAITTSADLCSTWLRNPYQNQADQRNSGEHRGWLGGSQLSQISWKHMALKPPNPPTLGGWGPQLWGAGGQTPIPQPPNLGGLRAQISWNHRALKHPQPPKFGGLEAPTLGVWGPDPNPPIPQTLGGCVGPFIVFTRFKLQIWSLAGCVCFYVFFFNRSHNFWGQAPLLHIEL